MKIELKWHIRNWNRKRFWLSHLIILWALSCSLQGGELLRDLDENLFLQSQDGHYRADLSGLLDLEGYYVDQRPPGLIHPEDDFLFNPRLSLFLDAAVGDHLYAFAQVRMDRGFDPGYRNDPEVRLDEYLIRYSPFDEGQFHIQAGKFATFFGDYVPRHLSWDNPFVTAPFVYENMTIAGDRIAPTSPGNFLGRRNRPGGDNKKIWVPAIWGPVYNSGIAVFGSIESFDYAFEFKNSALSSRPDDWNWTRRNWDDPTYAARIAYGPSAAWHVGTSAGYGAYLDEDLAIPGGWDPSDFDQLSWGVDAGYIHGHWQLRGEAVATRFDVPNVGDVETLGYHIELRRKWNVRLFSAIRWNQQFFDEIRDPAGRMVRWDSNSWRTDVAVGYRIDSHIQLKLQYSYLDQDNPRPQGEQMVAGQMTFRF